MRHRILRIFLATLLAFGFTVGLAEFASATNHEGPTELYFPWVPNGAMLGDSSPFYGTVTIQNLESREIRLFPVPTSTFDDAQPPLLQSFTLDPHASVTLSPSQMGFEDGTEGSAVIVSAEFVEGGDPARIAGVQKQAAAQPPTSDAGTGTEHTTVDGYMGLVPDQASTDVVLPVVQTNSGWNTVIRVTSFDEGATSNTVRVALHEAGGNSAPVVLTEVLGVGETETFDLLERGIAPEWVGSAVITADAEIGAVAERVKPATSMLIVNESRPSDRGSYLAPLMLREWNNWNTGISIVNLSDTPNEVTVNYYALEGQLVDTDELTIPSRGMDFIFTPANGGNGGTSDGFVGSAHIYGTGPLTAAVDEVKYFGDDEDTGHAMSYIAERRPGNDTYLLAPLVQKGDPGTGLGDTTGIQLVEAIGSDATVKIWFLDQLGNIVSPEPEVVNLGPREGYTAYTVFFDYLPSGFQGSALIRMMDGEVVAASNNVNYDVQYDGSASMNLIVADNLHAASEIELSTDPTTVPYYSQSATVSARVTDRFGEPFPPGWTVIFGEDADETYLVNAGGSAEFSSGPIAINGNGTASVEIHLRDEALGERPIEVTVTAEAGDVSEQVTVTWQAPPEVQLP